VLSLVQWDSNKCRIFWVCVCSLRYPARNAHAPCCHLCPAPLYNIFPHYLINGTIFGKMLLNTKCVFWFSVQLLPETFLTVTRTERDVLTTVHICRSACTVLVVLALFYWNLNFLDSFWKNSQLSNFIKVHQFGAEFFYAYGQTDLTKLIVAFRNLAKST